VFWFEQGIAAEVIVSLEDPSSYGVITRVIYFPPQTSEGYEMRWPYTVTRTEPFMPVDPAVPAERNPFDFETMIATTTASPRTTTPTPIPSDSRPVDTYFPRSLVCSDAVAGNGPSIGLVTIGETRLDEMEAIYMEYFDIGLEYSEATGETSIFLREFDSDFAYRNRVINICVVDGVIVAASNTFPTSTQLEQLGDEEISATPDPTTFQYTTIDMLVSQYGAPDVVTYSSQPFGRVAFWFEQGIAAVVYVRFDPPGSAYLSGFGTVSAIVYFPFQDVAGYEDRWPFTQTYPQERFATDDAPFVATDLPIERNPFDFDAMISTMTAEPSPTLAP
jgi:hypothetical protein